MQNNLTKIRKAVGITQQELADLCGGTKGQISKLENNNLNLTPNWLMRLERAFQSYGAKDVRAWHIIQDPKETPNGEAQIISLAYKNAEDWQKKAVRELLGIET